MKRSLLWIAIITQMIEHCNRGPYEDTFANRLAQGLRGDEGRGGSAINFKLSAYTLGCARASLFL